jgi:hypothetical protein
MTTECCLSTTTARLEGVNRPCGRRSGRGGVRRRSGRAEKRDAGAIAARRNRRPARRARRARRRAAVGRGRRRAQGRSRDVPWRCADVKGLARRSTQPLGACAMQRKTFDCSMLLRGAARHRAERLGNADNHDKTRCRLSKVGTRASAHHVRAHHLTAGASRDVTSIKRGERSFSPHAR